MSRAEPALAWNFETDTTLIRVLAQNAEVFPDRVAMREKDKGIWNQTTWQQLLEIVLCCAAGLEELDFKAGDVMLVLGDNIFFGAHLVDLLASAAGRERGATSSLRATIRPVARCRDAVSAPRRRRSDDAPSPDEPDTEQPVRARAATERAARARCGVRDMAVLLCLGRQRGRDEAATGIPGRRRPGDSTSFAGADRSRFEGLRRTALSAPRGRSPVDVDWSRPYPVRPAHRLPA